ncbi:hypothetical protein F5Y17DRAFT_417870 [Xylariaceae sp. FL0594]|nr:hypothetical protein F5Y17DRAFT_417870 [Xylariaceae sp. FL0594]
MDIKNPRRILAVSSTESESHLVRVIKDLTGSTPEQTSSSLAGSSHTLTLKTAYYTCEVPIWLDLVSSPEEWSASFLSAEAREVLDALGGVIVVFALPARNHESKAASAQNLIRHVGKVVRDGLGGWGWDGVGLCLGVGENDDDDDDDTDVWEDYCAEWGLEFVQVKKKKKSSGSQSHARNEYGEKTGIPRALEALESNDWSNGASTEGLLDLDLGEENSDFEAEAEAETGGGDPTRTRLDTQDLDFGFDKEDFAGLRRAIWNAGNEDDDDEHDDGLDVNGKRDGRMTSKDSGTLTAPKTTTTKDGDATAAATAAEAEDDEEASGKNKSENNIKDKRVQEEEEEEEEPINDNEIRKIERIMSKLQAVRDASVGLPVEQRKRAAARAVAEVMREL